MKYYILLFLTAFMGVATAQQGNDTIKVNLNNKVKLPFGELDKDKLVGAVDVIEGDALLHSSDYNIQSLLAAQAPGLIVFEGNGSPGSPSATMKIRGQSRGGQSDGPLVVIDGIANRALSSITVDEVESVQVLKDITAKMLYGSEAANGVIMINTKRGYEGKRKVSVFYESGIKRPSVLPEYVNSAQYARLYNQALTNDGKAPIYSNEQINNYANNPSVTNPDVDFYDEFVKKNTTFQRINAQLAGGSDNTKFFLNLGYVGENGLEKIGKTQKFSRLNVRSNLDYKVSDVVSMFIDISGRMDVWDRANITNTQFFNSLSTHRPNDYPLYFGEKGDTDLLGYSERVGNNLVGDLTRSGYVNSKVYYAQTNVGMNFNLNKYVSGLTASGYVSFDSYNLVAIGKSLQYSRIRPGGNYPTDLNDFTRVGTDVLDDSESRRGDDIFQNVGLVAKIDYAKSWADNDLQINLNAIQQTRTLKSTLDGPSTQQDRKNMNLGLRANYTLKNKYTAEISSSYMGSDKFTKENRWGLFGSGGLAWIISNEDFLKNSKSINYLKLKSSYGVMGYDRSFDHLLYRDFYVASGNFRTGPENAANEFGWRAGQIGNRDLTFEKSKELNVGVEARLFKNKVNLEVNYFNENRSDIPVTLRNSLPDYTGALKPIGNFNEISNKGVDFFVSYKDNIGKLKYTIGGNAIFSKAVHEVFDQINQYDHLNRTGRNTDIIWGYNAQGLYQNDADITNHGVASSIGDVIPGDIKYENITNDRGDNVIDVFDQKSIGNSFPRLNYALNLNLEYNGFELFVLGQGASGFDRLLNNRYYWNTGDNKYSVQALGSAVPGAVANATSPRLTSLSGGHSYRNSTYWLKDASFFKLRTIEVAYSFPEQISKKIGSSNFKVFIRGNDLVTISKIKDSDPENLNAGVTNYPMYKTVSLGLKLTY